MYKDDRTELHLGDCREVMREMPENSIDAIVTDPPYELGFMGKSWDARGVAYDLDTWTEALRVAKPGAHLVAFGGTRTWHRLACAIEDAGWEIRDSLVWMYGSGFPKSLDVSKAIDKAAGIWRGRAGAPSSVNGAMSGPNYERNEKGAPITELARQWEGWGTALKPAYEPIVLARKPLSGTVAANVEAYGTGAINVDGCRIEAESTFVEDVRARVRPNTAGREQIGAVMNRPSSPTVNPSALGRWPANVVLGCSCEEEHDPDCAVALVDEASGERPSASSRSRPAFSATSYHISDEIGLRSDQFDEETGGASRFFYTAKASRSEREAGLEGLPQVRRTDSREKDIENPRLRTTERRNHHPTVKPVNLMRWLCRLITPPNGVVLDPFMGSGSTRIAAHAEGFRFIGIDMEKEYVQIAAARAGQMGMGL